MLVLPLRRAFPFLKALVPFRRQQVDRGARVIHDEFRGQLGAVAVFLCLCLNPAPDIEVSRLFGPGDIPRRQLRNLDQAGFNCVQQPEIRNDPRERLSDIIPGTLDIKSA